MICQDCKQDTTHPSEEREYCPTCTPLFGEHIRTQPSAPTVHVKAVTHYTKLRAAEIVYYAECGAHKARHPIKEEAVRLVLEQLEASKKRLRLYTSYVGERAFIGADPAFLPDSPPLERPEVRLARQLFAFGNTGEKEKRPLRTYPSYVGEIVPGTFLAPRAASPVVTSHVMLVRAVLTDSIQVEDNCGKQSYIHKAHLEHFRAVIGRTPRSAVVLWPDVFKWCYGRDHGDTLVNGFLAFHRSILETATGCSSHEAWLVLAPYYKRFRAQTHEKYFVRWESPMLEEKHEDR